jgi:hypothetical protein
MRCDAGGSLMRVFFDNSADAVPGLLLGVAEANAGTLLQCLMQ